MSAAPQTVSSNEPLDKISCDVLVLSAFSSDAGIELSPQGAQLDAILDGALASLPAFAGKPGDMATVTTLGRLPAHTILVVGLGPKPSVGPVDIRRAAANAVRRARERSEIVVCLSDGINAPGVDQAAVEGALLGNYRYEGVRSSPRGSKLQRLIFPGAPKEAVERGTAVAEAIALARDLTNEPASTLTPAALASRAADIADLAGLTCTIHEKDYLEEHGFGGLLGVAQGSVEPPRLTVLHYKPRSPKGKVALIGKGVTYDTGGYSLKPSPSMERMKTDMGGAAAVIGVMSALKRLAIPVEVTAYLPSCDNMVSGSAIRPGDVLTQYGGKTVEVINTDAEGRLILADALVLAQENKPDVIVDIATLTGHISIALGGRLTGLFCNDDALQAEIVAAGRSAGETMWPMPLEASYRKDIDSDVADMKNVGPRYGGAITAALFLKEFVNDVPWAHLDIAGTGRADSDRDDVTKGGTGVGVRTLLTWLEERAK